MSSSSNDYSFGNFDLLSFISDRARDRNPVYFWENVPHVDNPHPKPIQLIGGLPNYQFFPITSADIHLRQCPFNSEFKTFTSDAVSNNPLTTIDIKNSLQYSNQDGLNPLLDQISQFVERVVKPISDDWKPICTLGGADGIAKCFDIFINPGDTVLFEEFTFTPVLNNLKNTGGIPVPIKMNQILKNGGDFDYFEELQTLLENWTTLNPNLRFPKILYTIPNGHNPLGLAQTLENKKKIYNLAEKYNFLIMEDEPYSYLNFDKFDDPNTNYSLSNDEFIDSLNPSYLTLDKSGRVIRIETYSKIFAPGMRLGYIIAHEKLIPFLSRSAETYTRAPNGFSQMFLNNTINSLGGIEGWIHWITQIRNEYLKRKNIYVSKLFKTQAYNKKYIDIIDPNCGMFVAVVVNVENHKLFNGENYNELMDQFYIKCVESGVLVVLGRNMSVDSNFSESRSNFVRTAICFVDTPDILVEAAERISTAAIKLFEE